MSKRIDIKYLTAGIFLAAFSLGSIAAELEEVTVTATKRQESLQDVNLAVTAVGGEKLEGGQIDTIEDIQALAPGLQAADDFAIAKIFIRGIGLNSSFTGVDPSVALHLDGAVIASSYAQLGAFFDLERIEVLRGPQGSLYGKNATGGAVNLVSRKPTEELEGYARLTGGSDGLFRSEAAVSGPITDNLLGRLATKTTDRDGFGINENTGNDVDDEEKRSMRGMLDYDVNEDLNVLLSFDYHTEDDANLGLKPLGIVAGATPSGAGGFPAGLRNINSERDNTNDRDSWSINGTINWDINDTFRLTSITNYRDTSTLLIQDLDNSTNINNDIQFNDTESETFSQELQLHFDADRYRGLVGLYFFNDSITNDNAITFIEGNALHRTGGFAGGFHLGGTVDIKAAALFSNVSVDVTDQFAINLGGRVTAENRKLNSFRGGWGAEANVFDDQGFIEFTPTLGFEWTPTDDLLAYFTYSEGFKGGGAFAGQGSPITDPETIENYEIGLKGAYFDNSVLMNLSGFFYQVDNMQLSRTQLIGGTTVATIFDNGAKAEGIGFELEMSWLATDNLRFDGNVAFIDTEFTELSADSPLQDGTLIEDLRGNNLRQAPEWSTYIRGEYDFHLNTYGTLTFGADYSYTAEQFFTEFNDPITGQDAYSLVNANMLYTAPGEQFTVNFWGRNVTDEIVRGGSFVSATGQTVVATLQAPAMYGVTVGYKF